MCCFATATSMSPLIYPHLHRIISIFHNALSLHFSQTHLNSFLSLQFLLSHLISSHLISSHLISFYLMSSHLITSHHISTHLNSSHLITSQCGWRQHVRPFFSLLVGNCHNYPNRDLQSVRAALGAIRHQCHHIIGPLESKTINIASNEMKRRR